MNQQLVAGLVVGMLAWFGGRAHAQMDGAGPYSIPTYLPDYTALNIVVNNATQTNTRAAETARETPRTVSTITTGRSPAVQRIATGYASRERAKAEALFAELLRTYGRLETQLGLPRGDVAGAMAVFIITNVETYRGRAVDTAAYRPLVAQLRQVIAADPAFAQMSRARRRQMFEELAILGMFMAAGHAALLQQPDADLAASFKRAARQYLAALRLDPDRVSITTAGLRTTAP